MNRFSRLKSHQEENDALRAHIRQLETEIQRLKSDIGELHDMILDSHVLQCHIEDLEKSLKNARSINSFLASNAPTFKRMALVALAAEQNARRATENKLRACMKKMMKLQQKIIPEESVEQQPQPTSCLAPHSCPS